MDEVVQKEAQEGTIMYRRTDVRSFLFKLNRRYLDAMRSAEREGNDEWRFNAVQKLRLIGELHERIENECPAFVNQAPAPVADVVKDTNHDG